MVLTHPANSPSHTLHGSSHTALISVSSLLHIKLFPSTQPSHRLVTFWDVLLDHTIAFSTQPSQGQMYRAGSNSAYTKGHLFKCAFPNLNLFLQIPPHSILHHPLCFALTFHLSSEQKIVRIQCLLFTEQRNSYF